jgi:hypothetical protein
MFAKYRKRIAYWLLRDTDDRLVLDNVSSTSRSTASTQLASRAV